tara:strand:- start:1347 stop:1562 length:216 start_codon:yes stop_codon:yes gene_type:complete
MTKININGKKMLPVSSFTDLPIESQTFYAPSVELAVDFSNALQLLCEKMEVEMIDWKAVGESKVSGNRTKE